MSQRFCFLKTLVFAGLVAGCLSGAQANIVMDTVPVGNPGNPGDTRYPEQYGAPSFGGVDYTYNIGKYEVTAGQYTAFLNAVGGVDTYGLYNVGMALPREGSGITQSGGGTVDNPYTYSVASPFVNRPVNFVSWGNSARFANWMHNGQPTGAQNLYTTEDGSYYLNGATSDAGLLAVTRKANATWVIPSEDEWYKAAYHKNDGVTGHYWNWPTSSDTVPGRDMADVSGNNANYYDGSGAIDYPYYTTLIGEFQNSTSAYGTFDQAGNVGEWNEAIMIGTMYRVQRGGAFWYNSGQMAASGRNRTLPTHAGECFGFRLSEVPEPATMALLALGCVGLLRGRKTVRG